MQIIKRKKIIDSTFKVNKFAIIFNSALFTGFFPIASGTVGSFFASLFFFFKGFNNIYVVIIFSVICFFVSLYSGNGLMKKYGDDPSVFVMDEVIGMWLCVVTFGLILNKYNDYSIFEIASAFIFFRIFDILKLWPVRYFDRMKTVFGILFDDVIAGIQAGILNSLFIFLIKRFDLFRF